MEQQIWISFSKFQCPELIALVYESYIPRVRYGAAMALGIACAGTGSREAMAIIGKETL